MKTMKISALAGATALALTLSACGGDATTSATTEAAKGDATTQAADSGSNLSGTISGSGASSQQKAQQAWRDNFTIANSGVTVNYEPTGSGTGRQQFLSGQVQYAGTDSALKSEELAQVSNTCKTDVAVELPVYISPIAIAVNLEGVKELKLDAPTIAKIFSGQIEKWNDPAIAATNSGVKLPDETIIPIHRAEKSGTTGNFQSYLEEAAPEIWTYGSEETWPIQGGQSAESTSGVVQLALSTPNSIIYADYSQIETLTPVKVKVGDEFIGPEPEAAARVVDDSPAAEGATDTLLNKDLKRDGSVKGAYPVVMLSYLIGCQEYKDASTGELVKAFFTYVVSEEGQKAAFAANGGNAPISDTLRKQAMAVIDTIK